MDARATAIECSVSQTTPAPPPSGCFESANRLQLSETLWGIRWEDILPHQVTRDVTVVASSFDQALPFIQANYSTIFEDEGVDRFFNSQTPTLKARYYRTAGDFFEFKRGPRTVGLLIGTAVDWSTYYIRSAASLPEFQGSQMIQRFFTPMFALLKAAGVERIEAETSPTNLAVIHLLSRMRFNPSGTVLTDRWGALLKLTRYLNPSAERVFIDQFCSGVHYQSRDHACSKRASV